MPATKDDGFWQVSMTDKMSQVVENGSALCWEVWRGG